MTLEQIKRAIDEGKDVYWSNKGYKVKKDKLGQYLIVHTGGHSIGLTWQDGVTMNGKEEDFFMIDENGNKIKGSLDIKAYKFKKEFPEFLMLDVVAEETIKTILRKAVKEFNMPQEMSDKIWDGATEIIETLEKRMLDMFHNDEKFNKKLSSNVGRVAIDWAYVWMAHWAAHEIGVKFPEAKNPYLIDMVNKGLFFNNVNQLFASIEEKMIIAMLKKGKLEGEIIEVMSKDTEGDIDNKKEIHRDSLKQAMVRALKYLVMYGNDNDDWWRFATDNKEIQKFLREKEQELALISDEYYEDIKRKTSELARKYLK